MRLLWTLRARAELRAIGRFIARENPAAARRHVERIRQRARAIPDHPFAGRVVPELAQDTVREVLLGNYRIIYHVGQDVISVQTVHEGHRLLDREDLPALPPPRT